jgi:hypothetical protein
MNVKIAAILSTLLLMSGCSTSPVQLSDSTMVPAGRLLPGYQAISKPGDGKAKVVVVRDSGMLGAAIKAKILVNGDAVGLLWSSERLEFYLPLGDHILGVMPEPQLAGALQENSYSFKDPKTYFFRFSVSESEGAMLRPTTQIHE